MHFKLLIGLLLFISQNTLATPLHNKFWSLFTINGDKGSYLYMIEPQIRFADNFHHKYDHFLLNGGLAVPISSEWQAWLGNTILNHAATPIGNRNEFRLWEQLIWQRPNAIKNVSLLSRLRLEQRKSYNFSAIANRLRERFIVSIALNSNYNLVTYEELFINFNRVSWVRPKTLDQTRSYIALEQMFAPNLWLSIGYLYQYIFIPGGVQSNVLLLSGRVNL
ncbi:MAG: DUF2490 domain-containing protein [Proteobacteria bacterium]|nr:DUF2490 domain-containing protein [Pseudomonadota bacterium]